MDNFGKDQFDAIKIPEELKKTVHRVTCRGMAVRTVKKAGVFVCLLALLAGITANIPHLYAMAAEIPVLGQIVRIMHIGSGGVAGQPVHGCTSADGEKIRIRFTTPSGEKNEVPEFSVMQRDYPNRMVLHFHGIGKMDEEQLLEILCSHPAVEDAYCLPYSEKDEVGVNVLIRDSMCGTVAQYNDGALEIGFKQAPAPKRNTAYVLCSEPMEQGKETENLYRSLAWEGASQIRTEDGRYQIFLGEFATWEQAEKARAGILEARKINLKIEKVYA